MKHFTKLLMLALALVSSTQTFAQEAPPSQLTKQISHQIWDTAGKAAEAESTEADRRAAIELIATVTGSMSAQDRLKLLDKATDSLARVELIAYMKQKSQRDIMSTVIGIAVLSIIATAIMHAYTSRWNKKAVAISVGTTTLSGFLVYNRKDFETEVYKHTDELRKAFNELKSQTKLEIKAQDLK